MEPKTGRGEGRSPGLYKADRREPWPLLLVSWSALLVSWSGLVSWSCGSCRLVLACLWVCGATRSLEAWVGGESGRRTGDADRGAALPAVWREPACPCEERRRELAGHARGLGSGAATLAAVETGRRDSPTTEGGAGNLPRSHGTRSVLQVPCHKGPRTLSATLVFGGGHSFAFE